MVTALIFSKLLPFTRNNVEFIFTAFTRGSRTPLLTPANLNIYEFLVLMVICSHANFINKIKLLFRTFDFSNKGFLSIEESILLYKSLVVGYLRGTGAAIPTSEAVEKAAQIVAPCVT